MKFFSRFRGKYSVFDLLLWMSQSKENLTTADYRFTFHQSGNTESSERHFSAYSPEIAKQMFELACKKDDLLTENVKINVWNRWADRWEEISDTN